MTRLLFQASAGRCAEVLLIRLPLIASDDDWRLLSVDEHIRAGRFHHQGSRSAFVTTRAALRRRLAEETGIAPASLQICADLHGRPFLRAGAPWPFDFNVSHCRGMAAIAVARGGRVGVDVEAHGLASSVRDLVPEVMGARERALLHTLDGDEFLRGFYGSWTRKEAVVKAIGIGLSYPVTTLDLPSDASECEVSIRTAPDTAWRVFTREVEAALTLSVAVSESVELAPGLPGGVMPLADAVR